MSLSQEVPPVSFFWVYQNSKEGPACDVATWAAYYMVTRTRMRAIAFLYFSYISPFKHTRCQRTSSCSSRIRKPSLLDLVPQRILRKVIELERISFSRTSKVVLERQVCRAYSSRSSTFREIKWTRLPLFSTLWSILAHDWFRTWVVSWAVLLEPSRRVFVALNDSVATFKPWLRQ
jgi:hypothetical protein